MNCDHVFDILTQGPFPTGTATDDDVERHLSVCHDCRAMAEALRPALSLLHESLDDEAADLPSYQGELTKVEGMVATVLSSDAQPQSSAERSLVAARPGGRTSGRRSPIHRSGLWLVLASVALSAFAVGLWSAAIIQAGGGRVDRLDHESEMPRLLRLASLNAPAICFPKQTDEVSPAAATPGLELTCCRNCHVVAGTKKPSIDALAVVVDSCSVCHQP